MREKIHSYLGFAKRSRNLIAGYNTCMYGLKSGRLRLIILTEGLAENTVKKFTRAAADRKVPLRIYGTWEELSAMAGESGAGVFGITDEGFAQIILKEIDQNKKRFETEKSETERAETVASQVEKE